MLDRRHEAENEGGGQGRKASVLPRGGYTSLRAYTPIKVEKPAPKLPPRPPPSKKRETEPRLCWGCGKTFRAVKGSYFDYCNRCAFHVTDKDTVRYADYFSISESAWRQAKTSRGAGIDRVHHDYYGAVKDDV